jgi:hypothetical protein
MSEIDLLGKRSFAGPGTKKSRSSRYAGRSGFAQPVAAFVKTRMIRPRLHKRGYATISSSQRHPPEALRFSGSLPGTIQDFALNQFCFLVRFINLFKIVLDVW